MTWSRLLLIHPRCNYFLISVTEACSRLLFLILWDDRHVWSCGNEEGENEYFKGSLKVMPVTEKLKVYCLSWYAHVKRRDDTNVTYVVWWTERGKQKKRWRKYCIMDEIYYGFYSDAIWQILNFKHNRELKIGTLHIY